MALDPLPTPALVGTPRRGVCRQNPDASARRPYLATGEVQVICAELDLPPARRHALSGTLSSDELDRAARFRFERDRDRFIARRGLLRELLGRHTGAEPASLVFSYGPFGKPGPVSDSTGRPLHFSAAHSSGVAAVAISLGGPLGIDIEQVRDLPDLPALAATVLSPREQREWQNLPQAQRLQALFDVWARKEAFLKGTGQGLSRPSKEIEVPLHPCGPDCQLLVRDGTGQVPGWTLRSLALPGFAMALALSFPPSAEMQSAPGRMLVAPNWTGS
ncbi:MAG TPA: 4'-phosphopantetheinyl transferase superfamily protein [Candidatus Acidoferrum sp.]|nr:4'-phosphopantetheinyl transferase superfamily protein [Candidatus Acidoferrum sp.]